ncbi:hypothetical protein Tco_0156107 [Tanacetum coccineum]
MFQSTEGIFFLAKSGCPSRENGKTKFNHGIWYIRSSICRSDLVEITDVSMWVFFIIAKKLLVLDKIQKTMLDLKVIRGDFRNNYRILVTLGGCFEQLRHSTIISHRNYGRKYRFSQGLDNQQKFVELVVVDVYGLENECACTK